MFSNQYSVRTVTNYAIRRLAVDYGVPLITNIQVAEMFADAMEATRSEAAATGQPRPKSLQEWYSVDTETPPRRVRRARARTPNGVRETRVVAWRSMA